VTLPQPVYIADAQYEAAETSVPASVTSVVLLAANPERGAASIRNDSSVVMYISHGGTASSTSPIALPANATYELPVRYTGQISAAWASATGAARIVEFA
jgi:hypothetical protein